MGSFEVGRPANGGVPSGGAEPFFETSSGQACGRTALFRLAPTAAKRDIQQQVLVPTQMRDHLVAM